MLIGNNDLPFWQSSNAGRKSSEKEVGARTYYRINDGGKETLNMQISILTEREGKCYDDTLWRDYY